MIYQLIHMVCIFVVFLVVQNYILKTPQKYTPYDLSINSYGVYFCGFFSSSELHFKNTNNITGGTKSRLGDGTNGFIVKYNKAGYYQWCVRLGTSLDNSNNSLNTLKATENGIFIQGQYESHLKVSPENADNSVSSFVNPLAGSSGEEDGSRFSVLLKYNNSGDLQWYAKNGSSNDDILTSIDVDDDGVYSSGHYSGLLVLNNSDGSQFSTTLTTNGNFDVAVFKYQLGGSSFPLALDGSGILSTQYNKTKNSLGPFDSTNYEYPYYRFVFESGNWYVTPFKTWDDAMDLKNAICYIGTSKIYAKNIKTGEIGNFCVKDIKSDSYLVYSDLRKDFVNVRINVISGKRTNFTLIKKDLFEENYPSEDLYITGSHPLLINGKEIKARNIKGSRQIKINEEILYSIVTDEREPLLINNLCVMSWKYDDLIELYKKRKNCKWTTNENILLLK